MRLAPDGRTFVDDLYQLRDLFSFKPDLVQAPASLLERLPGLGVEVNEAAIRAEGLRFWEAPHLRRRDGSVTNW